MNFRCLILLGLLWPAWAVASHKPRNPQRLLGKPMPTLRGTTLRGTRVDSSFFARKVTLLNFMYIGCRPCMAEAPVLRAVQRHYAAEQAFQMLTVAPHTTGQLRDFYARNKSMLSRLRQYLQLDSATQEVLPACARAAHREENSIGPECTTIAHDFYLEAYPLTVLIDKKGVVRKVMSGFAIAPADSGTVRQNSAEQQRFTLEWQTSINTLLQE